MPIQFQNFYESTLSAPISATDLVIPINVPPSVTEGWLLLDYDIPSKREFIYFTAKTGSNVSVLSTANRGMDGTPAIPHTQNAKIRMNVSAGLLNSVITANAASVTTDVASRMNETTFAHVASGLVWAGLGYGSSLSASMTSGVVYQAGQRLALAAIGTRPFTASRDTYIDVLNTAGVGSLVFTEVVNNAASPALASNSIRIGIIVTGATNILNVGSVNQGEEAKVLPSFAAIAMSVTDSLGNLICPRDPTRKVLGYKQVTAAQGGISGPTDITGLAATINVPFGRKIKISLNIGFFQSATNNYVEAAIMEGAATLALAQTPLTAASQRGTVSPFIILCPTAGVHTYKISAAAFTGGAQTLASATNPNSILIELM